MKYEYAKAANLVGIKKLLSSMGLPSADIAGHWDGFIVAIENKEIAGVVGMELYGEFCLLRSLAVHPDYRGQGVAKELFRRIVVSAKKAGAKELYLLTLTIESLCKQWGFKKIVRNRVPMAILASKEFKGLCPKSAVCMHQAIK
jgi:amino-acid N-acetyltransferase